MRVHLTGVFAACLLGGQLIGIARLPFAEDRFFCWSPHDSRTDFAVAAWRSGQPVPAGEIRARYRLPAIEWHGTGNLKQVIRTAERRLPPDQRWHVRLTYRINQRHEQRWEYPEAAVE